MALIGVAFAVGVASAVVASAVTAIVPPEGYHETSTSGLDNPEATAPGDTTTVTPTPGVQDNTAGGTGVQTIPTAGDIAREQAGIQNLQTKQFQMSGANTILGMKGEAVQGAGAMRAKAAARNIDVASSPLYNIVTRQNDAERQIALAGESLDQSVQIQGKTRDVGWNSFLLSGAKELDAVAQANADRWMTVFTDVVRIGTGIATGFPIPSFPTSVSSKKSSAGTGQYWEL
jgi:hypothetical protein